MCRRPAPHVTDPDRAGALLRGHWPLLLRVTHVQDQRAMTMSLPWPLSLSPAHSCLHSEEIKVLQPQEDSHEVSKDVIVLLILSKYVSCP